jgi:hypothetical protein
MLGRAGSGKSTAAQHIIDTWNGIRTSFARPLKELSKQLWEFTDEQVYGTQVQKETIDPRVGISPRTGMIRLGDGAREIIGKRVWVDACFNGILSGGQPLYVIDDVRYPNEAADIQAHPGFHGYVIKLVCPDGDSSAAYANASSEKSVDEVNERFIHETIVSKKSPGSVDLKTKVAAVVWDILVTHGRA